MISKENLVFGNNIAKKRIRGGGGVYFISNRCRMQGSIPQSIEIWSKYHWVWG